MARRNTEKPRVERGWRRETLERTRRSVARLVEARSKGAKPELASLVSAVRSLENKTSDLLQMQRLFYVFAALAQHARSGGLAPQARASLIATAEATLTLAGIKPGSSRLSYLFRELRELESAIMAREGAHLAAAWTAAIGSLESRRREDDDRGATFLAAATRHLRLGLCDVARAGFERAEAAALASIAVPLATKAAPLDAWLEARLGRARCALLAGDAESSLQLAAEARRRYPGSAAALWRERLADAVLRTDFSVLRRAFERDDPCFGGEPALVAWLFAWSSTELHAAQGLPAVRTMARWTEAKLGEERALFRAARQVELCYDQDIDFRLRVQGLGEVVARTAELPCLEHELLVLAAATRWLTRAHATEQAVLTAGLYRNLSLAASGGACDDILGTTRERRSGAA